MAISKTKKEVLSYNTTAVEPRLAYINVGTTESNNDYISLGFKPLNSKNKKDLKFITYHLTKDGGSEDNEYGYTNIAYLLLSISKEVDIELASVEDVSVALMNAGVTKTAETIKDLFKRLEESTTEEQWEYVEKEIKVKGNTYQQFNIYFKPKKNSIKAKAIREIFLK